MAKLMTLKELEGYIEKNDLLYIYGGAYLPEIAEAWYGKEGEGTKTAAIEMAQRGALQQNVRSTFGKIEAEAKAQGLEVRYDVDKSKNEITVVFVDKKGVVASEKIGLGTAEKTLKTGMAAPKSFAPHLSDRGVTLLTQTEEVALSFLETLKKTSRLKTSKIDKRDFLKSQLKAGKKAAEMSVVTSETHSVIDEDEFNIEDMYASSKERDMALHTKMRVGGIIGEVSKGVDFLSGLRKKNKITEQQARAKNERIDQYLTEYVATYQLLGERVAEDQLYTALANEELDLTEEELKSKIAETRAQFGDFLKMKPTFGLSKDEAFKSKKFSYAGTRSAAFRAFFTIGRHLDQVKNYLEKSRKGKRLTSNRLDEIFVSVGDKVDEGDTEHKLYSRTLIEDENAVLAALKQSIKEEIEYRQNELRKTTKFKKMSKKEQEAALKKIEDDIRAEIPEVNAAILEDMGLTKKSVMEEQESQRLVTGTISEKEFQKYEKEAIEDLSKKAEKEYNKLSDEQKIGQSQKDFVDKYISTHRAYIDKRIAEKASGRKGLSSAKIAQWQKEDGEIGYDFEAKEIIKGNVGKLLWLRTGLRETARGIDDRIFNRLVAKLGAEGTDVLGLAKKIKAEEIPGYAQAILTQKIINSTNEEKIKILKKLQELGFTITEKDGKYYVDNSMEKVEQQDWQGLIDYLTKDLKVFEEEIDKESGKKTYKFAKNAKGFRSLQFMDVANRADVWEPTKDVKVGYKEESSALREISAAGLKGAEKEAIAKDLKIIYDPTKGRTGVIAQKAQKDRDAILNKQTGSIVQTYRSGQSGKPRLLDADIFRKQSYKRGSTVADTNQTYVITIGNGSDYSIDINDLLKEKAKWDKSGGLTEEEYRKTIWGVIDAAKKELISQGVSPDNIQVAIDPGTDFGFEMYGQGAVGRFIYLPNIETDVRYDGDEAIYSLPEYSQDVNSLLGSLKRGVSKSTIKPKAQAAVQSILYAGQAEKSALGERAGKKRVGASKAGKVTEISRSKINELIEQGDIEAAERLMSAVYVSREAGLNMLRDKDKYITVQDGKEIYNRAEHGAFLTEALRYLKGEDIIKVLYGSKENLSEEMAKEKFAALDDKAKDELIGKLVEQVANAITDTSFSGKVKGLSGIASRFPSLQRHAALFGEMLIGGDLEAAEIRMGPAMTKILNGDYDGDTVNFILGLWSSGMSFDAAAKLVERQKRINRRFYDKMLKGTVGSDVAISGGDISRLKDDSMGLSALATKFNKPFTGIFSNMSTRIREGLKTLGHDYIDESGNVRDLDTINDYVDAIETELVTAVGQILEQDSISAKKVDERIAKRITENGGKDISAEEKERIQREVLSEFKELEDLIRNPETTYEQIIDRLEDMGLLGGDITQISASVASIIEDLVDNIPDEAKREAVLKRVGLTRDQLSSGKISAEIYRKAGKDLESSLYDKTGKHYKIFSGEFGSGLATSRAFTPFMKGDTYQLIKFLTETNDILRETGKIIDENNRSFNEYGETVKKTHGILEGEAAQESAKVIIAGKEGKAINRNADSYKNLADKLEEAGNNYKAINRLSTTELKGRLLPYAGQQTTGLDPKTLSKLSRKARRGEILSKEELAAAFGVKDEAALNSLFMGALSTRRGEYIHNLAQGDKTGARAKRKEITDLFKVFGYSDEQIQDTFAIYNLGAKNVKSITKKFGTSMGAEIPFIGMTSDGQYVVNARADELFYKQRPSRWDKNKTEDVVTIVDYKTHAGGKLSDEDIAQGIIYKTFLEEIRDFAKTLDKNISDEEAAKLFQKQIKSGLKYTSDEKEIARREAALSRITPDVAKVLRGGATIETSIIVVDPATGASQAYAIGADRDKYKQISNMLLSGDTSPLTAEQKVVLRGGAKQLTSADYFKPGVSAEEGKSIESGTKSDATAKKRNERLSEYIQLLKQEEQIKFNLAKIDRERILLEKEGISGDSSEIKFLEFQKSELEAAKADIEAAKADIETAGFSDEEAARIERTRGVERARYSYAALKEGYTYDPMASGTPTFKVDGDKLTAAETEDYVSRLEKSYNSILSSEKEILTYRLKAETTMGIESDNYRVLADLKEKALDKDRESLKILETIVNEVAPKRAEELRKEYDARKKITTAEALKSTRGATSIWDVMANDIQRATMRVADFGIAVKIMNKIPQSIQKVIQYTKELDTAMTNIRVVTGASAEEAKVLAREYTELAKELGSTTVEIANSANEWARQGYEAEEANKLIVASTKLAKLGMISSTEATKDLTSAIKGFKLSTEEAMSVVDKLTSIDAAAAISAGNLAEGLARVATTAQEAGLSLDQTAAMVTTITEVTQRDASTAGEALRTLISRYSNVKASVFTGMSDGANETSENINDIEKVLSKLSIRIRTSDGEMRNIGDVLDELADKWASLDDVTRGAVGSAFAGVRQRESFNILMQQWDRVKELTEESANAAGTADKKYTAYMDSMEAATKRLQNAWEGLTQSLETSPVMKLFTNLAAGVAENALSGFGWLKQLLPMLLVAQSANIVGSFADGGAVGGFKGLLRSIPLIGDFTKRNEDIKNIAKDVHAIKEETAGVSAPAKREGGLRGFLKGAFGRGDIVIDPETGKSVSYKDAAKYRTRYRISKLFGTSAGVYDEDLEKASKILAKRQLTSAAFGAGTAFLTQLGTTKEIGTGVGGWIGKLFSGNYGNEQTIEETSNTKTARVLVSTLGAGIGGAIGGPLGATLGQAIGEGATSIVSTIVHRSELEMKQRVEDSKLIDRQLSDIKTSIDSISLDFGTQTENYETYQKRKEEVEALRDKINTSDDAVRAMINAAAIGRGYGGYDDMLDSLLDTDIPISQRENVKNDLLYIIASEKAKNYRDTQLIELEKIKKARAQIEGRAPGGIEINFGSYGASEVFDTSAFQDALKKAIEFGYLTEDSWADSMSSDFNAIALGPIGAAWDAGLNNYAYNLRAVGDTPDEMIANYKKFNDLLKNIGKIDYLDSESGIPGFVRSLVNFGGKNRGLQDIISAIDEMIANYNQGNKLQSEWQSNYALAGIYGSKLSLMKPSQLRELGMEGAIQEVADFLEREFGAYGMVVRDETGEIIESVHDDIEKAIKDDETLYNNLVLPRTSIKAWRKKSEELSDILDKLNMDEEDLAAAAEKGGIEFTNLAKSVGMSTTELRSLLNSGSSEYLNGMAESIYLTGDELLRLSETIKGLDKISFSDLLFSPSELTEKFDLMREAFLAAIDGSWAGDTEILNKINSDTFIKGFITNINDAAQTAKELGDILYSSGTSLESFMQGYSLFKDVAVSKSQMEGFINYLNEVAPKLTSIVADMTNIQEILDYLAESPNADLQTFLEGYLKLQEVSKYKEELDKSMQAVIKNNQKQIENLNQQKDALKSINDERKKELEYIKARIALEDAQKEKKRVYVQGVGWTYQVDETAVSEAKEKLDELDIEKQQDLLQVQIDQLEQQNSILESLPDEKELKKLEEALNSLTNAINGTDVVHQLVEKYNNPNYSFDIKSFIEAYINSKMGEAEKHASGTLSMHGGLTMLNEFGTEGIITPQGTLTALPSKTGVVPADITKNVWALGEVAPTLVASLKSLTQKPISGNAGNTTYEEGQYIDSLTMNVYPTKDYDMDKLLREARAKVNLTRHNN